MGYLRNLMKQPSTYAGAAVVSIVAGQIAGPEAMTAAASNWGALIAALLAVLMPERGGK